MPITLDGGALQISRQRAGLTGRELGRRVADRLGDPTRAKTLSVTFSRIEAGVLTSSLRANAGAVDELAAELGVSVADLTEPVLWTFEAPGTRDEPHARLVELSLTLPLFSTREAAYEARGVLCDRIGCTIPYELPAAELVPTLAGDRERWLWANMPDELTDADRELVLLVDPSPRRLLMLRTVHRLADGLTPAAARRAVNGLRELEDADVLPATVIDELCDLSLRRLACDRLRDAGSGTYRRWRDEHEHLAAAQHLALQAARERLTSEAA